VLTAWGSNVFTRMGFKVFPYIPTNAHTKVLCLHHSPVSPNPVPTQTLCCTTLCVEFVAGG
jgi:hypothetical protein